MKKLLTFLGIVLLFSNGHSQWTKTSFRENKGAFKTTARHYYSLDLQAIRSQLANAEQSGQYSKPVVISIPTLNGKVERFNVYSEPVMDKEVADKYQLGSYAGVGIDDPSKYVRFSVAPNDFQSMIFSNGGYEFIEPANASKTVYKVFPKTTNTGKKAFVCSTHDGDHHEGNMDELYKKGQAFQNNAMNFAKSSDKKYRTYRLAISTTGEYTQFFNGVAGANTQINATMTRVNGVFEKDFAIKLIVGNHPSIIYTNGATDPYTNNLNVQLQQTLTAQVGHANYDIGHLFNAAGNNGNAGCIGCICENPSNDNDTAKGSAFTQSTNPQGEFFDIDFVAHEIGHQLGANHTFSHSLEGTNVNMEPGSGSTIMGYAGITNADVQQHSDAYFHAASIHQVQTNLASKTTCGTSANITNDPPVIANLPNYTIPKGTAFVLTASATDPQNDPITYTWEQYNNSATTTTNVNPNSSNTPIFRSVAPSPSPTRYFPRLTEVMNGNLTSQTNWETVSNVARALKFRVTARDNHPTSTQQQTSFKDQNITVGNEGPFVVNTGYANSAGPTTIEWAVANTNAAPYNVANVKIDYTTDNGVNWVTVLESTVNDGSEPYTFPSALQGQTIKLRISAIGNVFYAVKPVQVTTFVNCDGSAPTGVAVNNITSSSAIVTWAPISGATYSIRYKKASETAWQTVTSSSATVTLNNLTINTAYHVQVAAVCSGTTGTYSGTVNFSTVGVNYCAAATQNSNFDYISNVTLANLNNTSANSTYTNYTTNAALQVNLVKGQQYTISVTKAWMDNNPDFDAVSAWIDFNLNGTFEDNERVLTSPVSNTTPVNGTFTVPATAVENQALRMRVISIYAGQQYAGQILGQSCLANQGYGEVEDYNVVVAPQLSTSEVKNSDFNVYPNPATDVLHVSKVSDKATYKIHNAAGQLVDAGTISRNQINVSKLVTGNYIITVKDKDYNGSVKFIKK